MMPDCNHAMHRGDCQRHGARAVHTDSSLNMDSIYHEFALLPMVSAPWRCACASRAGGLHCGRPSGFGWGGAHGQIDLLAQIGVTMLLFVVGLKLDLHHIRHIGPVAGNELPHDRRHQRPGNGALSIIPHARPRKGSLDEAVRCDHLPGGLTRVLLLQP